MSVDATMRTVLVAALLAIGLPACLLLWKMPEARLTDSERELIKFSTPPRAAFPPRPRAPFAGLDNPVRAASKQAPAAGVEVKGSAPAPIPAARATRAALKPKLRDSFGSRPTLSMIYSEGSKKTAIIDGQVLHEGSLLGNRRVVKIEKTHVLLRTADKEIWLSID